MADTSIEWTHRPGTRGETWNPVTGCSKVSPGCRSCYAEVLHRRLTAMGQAKYSEPFSVVRTHPDALDLPLRTKAPTTYFVNSMSDLFHADVPDEFIDRVIAAMLLSPRHTFLTLTKRADRLRAHLSDPALYQRVLRAAQDFRARRPELMGVGISNPATFPAKWLWWGVSAENQEYADERIPHLLATPAAVRFVSYEPALGPVRFGDYLSLNGGCFNRAGYTPSLDWIIFGSESGRLARSPDVEWARAVRDACQETGTAFFLKQLPGIRKGSKVPTPELDGRRWTEWPATDTSPNSPERQAAARSGMTPTTGAGATSSARAAPPPCGGARAQGPTGDAGDACNTGGGAHGSPPALSSEHVHRFKVTPITTRREPFLRCECGAWTGKARNEDGLPPYSASMAKRLETRLAKAGPPAPSSAPWPDRPLAQTRRIESDTTAAVDELLARRSR